MSSTGERVVERYIKHPAPASGYLADGDPFDAGSAHILHSNAAHLAHRNVRLIGHALGPGDMTYASTVTDAWDEAFDVPAEVDSTITWTRQNSVCFGPIALAHNRLGSAPAGFWPRKVRVAVQGFKGPATPTELYVAAALTSANAPPYRAPVLASVSTYVDDTDVPLVTGGAWTFGLTLEPDRPVRPSALWLSRPGGTDAPAHGPLAPAWVWVGFWTTSTAAVTRDRIESISAFEVWS